MRAETPPVLELKVRNRMTRIKQHNYHLTKNRLRFQKIKTIELGTKKRKKINRLRAGIKPRRKLETWGIYTRAPEPDTKKTCQAILNSVRSEPVMGTPAPDIMA